MRRALLFLGLLACNNSPTDTTDDTDDTEADTDVDTDETDVVDDTDPTFTRVRDEVFNLSCSLSTCHGAGEGSGGLRLGRSAAEDHAELVGVAAEGKGGETRVIAGDADGSYLVKKMAAQEGIEGDAMPPGFPLSEDLRNLVKDWIAAGALDN